MEIKCTKYNLYDNYKSIKYVLGKIGIQNKGLKRRTKKQCFKVSLI